jgi:hypothetical protein
VQKGVRERRDVVVTTGPFLQVTANEVGIGGLARPRAGSVTVHVHLESVAASAVDHVALVRASGEAEIAAPVVLRSAKGGLTGDVDLALGAKHDDAFVVVAEGRGRGAWAVSGPIWVDADGDGESLGRKETKR